MSKEKKFALKEEFPDSTLVRHAAYDEKSRTLEVALKSSDGSQSIYHYHDVSPETYTEFVNSPSAGTFFVTSVKDLYDHEKVFP